MKATLENLKIGTVVHGDIDRTIVAVASPVWPRGSQADRHMRVNREHGSITLRVFMEDGTASLWHNDNEICA